MPTLIEMQLKASWTLQPNTTQLHGLACALLEDEHSDHLGHDKPFAIWPVHPVPGGSPEAWEWRVAWLPDTPPPASAVTAAVLRIGHVSCSVTESRQHRVTKARLADGQPLGSATVTFRSPTYFSQNGTDVVLPDPRLIAGSWRRRWNASLPDDDRLAIDDEVWKETQRLLGLGAFSLRTEARDTGHGRDRLGFTGTATLRLARNAPVRVRKTFGMLVRFAGYCGTGAQTTHGFGATSVAFPERGSDG